MEFRGTLPDPLTVHGTTSIAKDNVDGFAEAVTKNNGSQSHINVMLIIT